MNRLTGPVPIEAVSTLVPHILASAVVSGKGGSVEWGKRSGATARERLLAAQPRCVYCGKQAETTDHCPPRCFFEGRQWPETYEFPACRACNEAGRADELALSVIARLYLHDKPAETHREWQGLLEGVRNNYPELLKEWRETTANQRKRVFRSRFGKYGDIVRGAGFGVLNFGPLTTAATQRFGVKLGKALYYWHLNQIFDGDMYVMQMDPFVNQHKEGYLESLYDLAPAFSELKRGKIVLNEQFNYRFNYSIELGVLYCIAHFGTQLVIQILAVSKETVDREEFPKLDMPTKGVFNCRL